MAAAEYIMALDVGEKRIGVALAHVVARLPRALTTLQRSDHVYSDIAALVQEERVAAVVVGLPRGMDGGYTEQTRRSEAFKTELAEHLAVPIYLADETLSSIRAEAELGTKPHTKEEVDALAACFILEEYLQSTGPVELKHE